MGHQRSGTAYPSIKVYLRTVQEIDEYHVTNFADDRMDSSGSRRVMPARGKLHKNIINRVVFPVMSQGNVLPPVLHIFLGVVLKLFKILLECVKSQDCTSNESGTQANEGKWNGG